MGSRAKTGLGVIQCAAMDLLRLLFIHVRNDNVLAKYHCQMCEL